MQDLVPQGRLKAAQDVSPGVGVEHDAVPKGRLKITQDEILGTASPATTRTGVFLTKFDTQDECPG
ncbi:MAG TPA: hypothetical protein VMB49_15785 [Acidobacteriaceae bacterium]|nr:hypothetical protein [Acidobacteriaceae bacterium]